MAMQAQDTFVVDIDGVPVVIQKGQVFPNSHAAVKIDAGRGLLFRPLDIDDDEPPKAKRGRPRKSTLAAVPSDDGADDGDDE